MPAFTCRFPRRAHGGVGVVVEARGVAVAVERVLVCFAQRNRNAPVPLTASRYTIDAKQRASRRRGDLAGIELVERIERRLDLLQLRIQRSEELGRVLRPHALAV